MSRPACTIGLALGLLGLTGCALLPGPPSEPLRFPFDGPGRLALLWEVPDASGDVAKLLCVYGEGGARPVPVSDVVEVRWLGFETLLLAVRARSDDPTRWGLSEVIVLEVDRGRLFRLMPERRHFNLEVSPDLDWLAVGVDVNDQGDSELEIWYVGGEAQMVATRFEPLDEARWSPDSVDLIVARAVQDPDAEQSETSAGIGGVSLAWPRLFRIRRDLATSLGMLHDGAPGEGLEPGGTSPLWWDEDGVWARQRRGLARCGARAGGCTLAYDPGPSRRVVDGRRIADGDALLLVLDVDDPERLPTEIHRVDLATGEGELVFRTRPGTYVTDLHWTR